MVTYNKTEVIFEDLCKNMQLDQGNLIMKMLGGKWKLLIISRIYIADYLEKISLFLFETVSEEDLNKWYEKRDKYELLEKLGGTAY